MGRKVSWFGKISYVDSLMLMADISCRKQRRLMAINTKIIHQYLYQCVCFCYNVFFSSTDDVKHLPFFFLSTYTPKHELWDIIKTSEFMTFAERLFKLLNHVFNRFFATVWITNTRIYWNISIYPPKCQVNFLNRKGIG